MPNSNLVRAAVDNYGRRQYRRWKTYLGVQYDTPPDKLVAFTEGIRELVRSHPYTRKDYFQVYLNQFGPSSLDILLYIFHEVPDWSTELRERERMFLDIVRLADQLGVQFAFPTQTVHLYREEHAEHEIQSPTPRARPSATPPRRASASPRCSSPSSPGRRKSPGRSSFARARRRWVASPRTRLNNAQPVLERAATTASGRRIPRLLALQDGDDVLDHPTHVFQRPAGA